MNTCDTCKWWDDSAIQVGQGISNDGGISYSRGFLTFKPVDGLCGKLEHLKEEEGIYPQCRDCDGVRTGPKFGCVHHEFALAKPSPSTSA